MARTFRVGILGYQDEAGQNYFGFKYGAEVFDLTSDQICSLLDTTDTDLSVQTSHSNSFPAPVMTYTIMVGGRFYPEVSREELSKAVEGIEILIVRMNFSNFYSVVFPQQFFETVFTERLSDRCRMVIARIVGDKQTSSSGLREHSKTDNFLKTQGLDIGKYKGKFFIVTDKSKTESKNQKKGNKVSIDRVRSELASEELKVAITQPIKETITAGKAVIGLGTRMKRWFSSLIKTQ